MPLSCRLQSHAAVRGLHRLLCALVAVAPAATFAQSAPAVSTILAFAGSQPSAAPVRGPDGALYGTSSTLAGSTGGVIYRVTTNGSEVRTLHEINISDGYTPLAGLLLGSDEEFFYGTTAFGTATQAQTTGTVYRIEVDGGGFTVLHRFANYTGFNTGGGFINADGASPEAELTEGSDGFLYGVTRAGGANGTGVVFKISTDGESFAVLHEFGLISSAATVVPVTNADGINPVGPLLEAPDGYFYGTASAGGTTGNGTIYRLRFDGSDFSVVHTFPALVTAEQGPSTNATGSTPLAGLTDGEDGRLYGVAGIGGANGYGTLFALDPVAGTVTVLHHFAAATSGSRPTGELLLAADSKLYGTTSAGGATGTSPQLGSAFSIARDGTGFATLVTFDGTHGSSPTGRLLQLDATTFVGVAPGSGNCGQGTIYQLSLTGAKVEGNTRCGRKKNNGGGGTGLAVLLLLGAVGFASRLRTD